MRPEDIIAIRTERNWTIEHMAKVLGYKPKTIERMEKGTFPITKETMTKLVKWGAWPLKDTKSDWVFTWEP